MMFYLRSKFFVAAIPVVLLSAPRIDFSEVDGEGKNLKKGGEVVFKLFSSGAEEYFRATEAMEILWYK